MTPTRECESPVVTDPARLAAVAVLSAAGACLAGLDIDAATAVVRREMDCAALRGRAAAAMQGETR